MISVEDQRELEDLHNRHAHAADRGDFDLMRSLYADDAIEEHGDFIGPVDQYLEWLRSISGIFEIATHTLFNLLARVDGDRAESEARGTAYLRLKGDQPFSVIVVNRYFDHYRRVEGRWLFSRRSVCVDWAEQFAPRAEALELVGAFPVGATGTADPVYTKVPGLMGALRNSLPALG